MSHVQPVPISVYLEADAITATCNEPNSVYGNLTGTVPYTCFKFMFPPRAEHTFPIEQIANMPLLQNYWFEPKLNGSNTLIILDGKGGQEVWNRHREKKTNVSGMDFTPLHRGEGFMILCGEYMDKSKKNNAGMNFNGSYIIWDIIAANNTLLTGTTLQARKNLIEFWYDVDGYYDGFISRTKQLPFVYRVNPIPFTSIEDLKQTYYKLAAIDMYEGFVLKNRDAILQPPYTATSNAKWQFKCRKPTKNYNF